MIHSCRHGTCDAMCEGKVTTVGKVAKEVNINAKGDRPDIAA